jgi:hypothetical protein
LKKRSTSFDSEMKRAKRQGRTQHVRRLIEHEQIGLDEQRSSQSQPHPTHTEADPRLASVSLLEPREPKRTEESDEPPSSRERPCRLLLIGDLEPKTDQQLSRPRRSGLGLDVDKLLLSLAEPGSDVVLLVLRNGGVVELGGEVGLFGEEVVTPDIGLEDRLEGSGVVSVDLLLDVEDGDVRRDLDLS